MTRSEYEKARELGRIHRRSGKAASPPPGWELVRQEAYRMGYDEESEQRSKK